MVQQRCGHSTSVVVFLFFLATFSLLCNVAFSVDLCSLSFCDCSDAGTGVNCKCDNPDKALTVDPLSLPQQARSFRLSNCGSIVLRTDSLARCLDLDVIELDNLKSLELQAKFFSRNKMEYKELSNLTLSRVGRLTLAKDAFTNFPKVSIALISEVGMPEVPEKGLEILTDTFIMEDSNIGIMHRSSLYSDPGQLRFSRNRVERLLSGAFNSSVREFEFSANTVDFAEENAFSVAVLYADITENTFANYSLTGIFADFEPDPACDSDTDAYEDEVVYYVLANPTLKFSGNNFLGGFAQSLLDFPGANDVPLGSLHLQGNKLNCDCESLKPLAISADFEHLNRPVAQDSGVKRKSPLLSLGAKLFRKEFYDSGLCTNYEGVGIKQFMRERIHLNKKEDGKHSLSCTIPEEGLDSYGLPTNSKFATGGQRDAKMSSDANVLPAKKDIEDEDNISSSSSFFVTPLVMTALCGLMSLYLRAGYLYL